MAKKKQPDPQPDKAAERHKPFYDDGKVTLYQTDARRLHFLEDNSVALTVTSPPYNVGIPYDTWDDLLDDQQYAAFTYEWLAEVARVTRPGGRLCLNIPNHNNSAEGGGKADGLATLMPLYLNALRIVGFTVREVIVWVKAFQRPGTEDQALIMGSSTAWGSWRSPANPYLRTCHEYIVVAHKDSSALTWKGESDLTSEEFLDWTRSVWTMPTETDRKHPAPFPLELPRRCIKLFSFIGDTVLDPFVGSGTTLLAARELGRRAYGSDLSSAYLRQAAERASMDMLFLPPLRATQVIEEQAL